MDGLLKESDGIVGGSLTINRHGQHWIQSANQRRNHVPGIYPSENHHVRLRAPLPVARKFSPQLPRRFVRP